MLCLKSTIPKLNFVAFGIGLVSMQLLSLELTSLLIYRLELLSLGNEARPIGGQKAIIVNSSVQVKFCLTSQVLSVARSNEISDYF